MTLRLGLTVHSTWLDVVADPVRLAVLCTLSELGEASAVELIERGPASAPTVRRHLEVLVDLDLVREHRGESDGLTPGRPAACYSLDPDVRERVFALFDVLSQPIATSSPRTA